MQSFKKPLLFQWDSGNDSKNWTKHGVTKQEAEEVFFDREKKIAKDAIHSSKEQRFVLIGKTKEKRSLYIVFTIRNDILRVISARDLNKKEYRLLEK